MRFLKDNQIYNSFDKKENHFSIIINLSKSLQSTENQRHINFYFETFR